MAKKSMIAKAKRTPKHKVQAYHRCTVCGRKAKYRIFRGYRREEGLAAALKSLVRRQATQTVAVSGVTFSARSSAAITFVPPG